jgi:hypothetical protein
MRFNELNKNNYMLFAIKFYNNPQALTKEDFDDDLKRIKYVKRLLKKYKNTGEIKVHLVLNHLIVLFNVFDEAAVPLLFYNLEEELWPSLKSFLVFLKRIPEYPRTTVNDIVEDEYCLSLLEKI